MDEKAFEKFFYRVNGRYPKPTEITEMLAIIEASEKLDPFLLMMVCNTTRKDQQDKQVDEMQYITAEMQANMQAIATDTINKIQHGLPTSPEWNKAAAWATKLTNAVDEVAQHIGKVIVAGGICLALIMILMSILLWRIGYNAGYDDGKQFVFESNRHFYCRLLDMSRHKLKLRTQATAAQEIENIMIGQSCDINGKSQ